MELELQNKREVQEKAPTVDATFIEGPDATASNNSIFRLTKRFLFLLMVLIPSALSGFYFGFIASDQYVVEARMVVRSIGLSEQFASTEERDGRPIVGGDSLTQDSYIVESYLSSSRLVEELDNRLGLRKLFSDSKIDYFSRLAEDASIEDLHAYWLNQIETYVDGPSGIIIFRVRGFNPETTLSISNEAIKLANQMIDLISERAKRDLVKRAESELSNNLAAFQQALVELQNYQNKVGILDPQLTAKSVGKTLSDLVKQKIEAETRLAVLKANGVSRSVTMRLMTDLITSLEDQIAKLQSNLTGVESDTTVADRLTDFARLETQRLIALALYRASERNLGIAKSTALRRTTFLALFSKPTLPSKSTYPERLPSWFLVFLGSFCVWVTLTLIWLSIEDHRV